KQTDVRACTRTTRRRGRALISNWAKLTAHTHTCNTHGMRDTHSASLSLTHTHTHTHTHTQIHKHIASLACHTTCIYTNTNTSMNHKATQVYAHLHTRHTSRSCPQHLFILYMDLQTYTHAHTLKNTQT